MNGEGASWPSVSLGEICDFRYGKSLPASERDGQGYPVYGSNGVVGFHSEAITSGPTIIVGRKGSLGEVHLSDGPCWPIDTTYYVDASATTADLGWLRYLLVQLKLKDLNRAAAIPGLNRQDAYRLRHVLPPLGDQRRIAGVLDAADALRAKRRLVLTLIESLPDSVFLDMFGRPSTPGSHQVSRETARVADLTTTITKGTTPTSVGLTYSSEGVPFLRVQNLTGGTVDLSDVLFVNTDAHAQLSRSRVLPGDILVSIAGTIGRVAIVPDDAPEMNCNQAVAIVRLAEGESRRFVAGWLQSRDARRQIASSAVTATISNLSLAQLGNLVMPLPAASCREEFAARVEGIAEHQNRCAIQSKSLDELFSSLEHQAFHG